MRFALIAKDKPNALDVRLANRDAHVAYLKSSDAVEMAGPFLDADGNMCGSLIVLEFEDIAEAQAWAANDPYKKADLFQSVEITAWNKVIG
ncbi:YciI family protein [Cognatishimia activa]|uniref:YciI-like protein n=1 Tax=Cognatishimia activa TaxID=1715691 RepID=A0A0P1ILP1_9RHOB|nr:YciI family protein [Cognatishimia activa]CUI40077.1 YciI-like protein [Cognatishimia activa]CUK24540.1 YciI-like protein [Cognatishimia activa]